jgi:outer membrane lipoprotein-sorting protein
VYVDTELQESTYVPLSITPAGILVRDPVRLSGDITVTGVERGARAIRIELLQTKEPDAGRVTLVFQDEPLALRQWTVRDAQGVTTTVSLVDAEFGVAIDPKVFVFQDPRFAQPPER